MFTAIGKRGQGRHSISAMISACVARWGFGYLWQSLAYLYCMVIYTSCSVTYNSDSRKNMMASDPYYCNLPAPGTANANSENTMPTHLL